MSRTLSSGMTTHLSGSAHSRCYMLRITLTDGTVIGITDHDKDIDYDLDSEGMVTYDSRTGVLTSDVSLSAGLDADNYEITGPIQSNGNFTQQAIVGGRFDRASVKLFQVNHKRLADGPIKLMAGKIAEARAEGGRFVFEVRSDFDLFNQTVGRVLTPYCDADYGDARCGATAETLSATVAVATSALQVGVTYTGTYADNYFDFGTVTFTSGELLNTRPVEIWKWDETATGVATVTLFTQAVDVPAVGDTLTITRGCPRTRAGCMARNNIVNFRGFPEIPGSDQVLRPTIPGQGND